MKNNPAWPLLLIVVFAVLIVFVAGISFTSRPYYNQIAPQLVGASGDKCPAKSGTATACVGQKYKLAGQTEYTAVTSSNKCDVATALAEAESKRLCQEQSTGSGGYFCKAELPCGPATTKDITRDSVACCEAMTTCACIVSSHTAADVATGGGLVSDVSDAFGER